MSNFSRRKQELQKYGDKSPEITASYHITKSKSADIGLENLDGWVDQILYWRTHLDVFIETYFSTEEHKVQFFPFQKSVIRDIGNMTYVIDDESRGLGKTYKVAWALIGLCVLYPTSRCLCISGNARQAALVLGKIKDIYNLNEVVRREIRGEVKVNRDGGEVVFQNGSRIDAKASGKDGDSLRGGRYKIIVTDEAFLVRNSVLDSARPSLTNPRDAVMSLRHKEGCENYPDYGAKIIEMSSANYKFTDHFGRLVETVKDMIKGKPSSVYCLPYRFGIHHGLFDPSFIEGEKNRVTPEIFAMEYECRHVGVHDGGFYDYEMIMKQRDLEKIELMQPKKSQSEYIISCDIATSQRKGADNACLGVFKYSKKTNGSYDIRQVYIRTYAGHRLDELAIEIRRLHAAFPNTSTIIVDINGLGEGIPPLLEVPYFDEVTNSELPPLVSNDIDPDPDKKYLPIVYGYRGTNDSNNSGALAIKLFLEKGQLHLPSPYMSVKDSIGSDGKLSRELMLEEASVFMDADALMHELMNIRVYKMANGIRYDVPRGKRKDRFSMLLMACWHIYKLENSEREDEIKNKGRKTTAGISYNWRRSGRGFRY